jgi:hypothetical protein
MQTKHGVSREETADMFHYFISRMLPWEIEMKVMTRDDCEVKRVELLSIPLPRVQPHQRESISVGSHGSTVHKEMKKDMRTVLGMQDGRKPPTIPVAKGIGTSLLSSTCKTLTRRMEIIITMLGPDVKYDD